MFSGRVELCFGNRWGTISRYFWGEMDAKVACKQLGLSTEGAMCFRHGLDDGPGDAWLTNVRCTGNESRIIDCNNSNTVNRFQDAGVNCSNMLTSKLHHNSANV